MERHGTGRPTRPVIATCGSGTAATAAPCGPSTASASRSGPARSLGLVGESGCGKSTLGRGLMGLLPEGAAIDGQVLFQGQRPAALLGDKAAAAHARAGARR